MLFAYRCFKKATRLSELKQQRLKGHENKGNRIPEFTSANDSEGLSHLAGKVGLDRMCSANLSAQRCQSSCSVIGMASDVFETRRY